MVKKFIRAALLLFATVAVLYPTWVWYTNSSLARGRINLIDLFPVFGLIAFSTMWLHIVSSPFREKINLYIDHAKFVLFTSIVVFVSLILHPLLLLVGLDGASVFDFVPAGKSYLIWIAVIAWVVFVSYDVLKRYRAQKLVAKYWKTIKLVSTLAFFLVLFHSLALGRDLQSGPLRSVWIFYGLSAAVATVYTYFVRK